MVSEHVMMADPEGFHMRPAQVFSGQMAAFSSDVTLAAAGKELNGKSLMSLMSGGIKGGTDIEVRCDGADEAEALAKAIELISAMEG